MIATCRSERTVRELGVLGFFPTNRKVLGVFFVVCSSHSCGRRPGSSLSRDPTTPLSPRPSPSSLIMEFVRRPATRRARINNWLFLGVLFHYRVRKQAGLTTALLLLSTHTTKLGYNSMTHTLSHVVSHYYYFYSWLGEGKQTFLAIWTN